MQTEIAIVVPYEFVRERLEDKPWPSTTQVNTFFVDRLRENSKDRTQSLQRILVTLAFDAHGVRRQRRGRHTGSRHQAVIFYREMQRSKRRRL